MKTASFEPTLEPTPPGTADKENDERRGLTASGSLRQSPPPATDESQMPAGAIISPPESSDEDETSESRGRKLEAEKLVELEAAIRVIEQHRQSSPVRTAPEAVQVLEVSPTKDLSTAEQIEAAKNLRKIVHSRSNTESVFIDLRNNNSPDTPLTGSDEDDLTDDDTPDKPRRKPQMLRKKSGELVRPALRPSSARRRPSSMPGTPTFSKAVHFDSHLEHVRHFLQVDRPLAVSAGSSPVEAYDSDTEFPFGEDGSSTSRSLPFEWEIVVSNFPAPTPHRLSLPVRVERVFLSADNKTLIGSVAVANLAFHKCVIARFTLDYWKTTSEVVAEFNNDIRQPKHPDGCDRFNFNIKLADLANLEAKTMFFCVKYCVNGQEYWDNNSATNFQIDFRKKAKPMNGKKGAQPASSKPVNSLPRSHKKSPPIASGAKKLVPTAFDDFADGFDKYKYDEFHQPVSDYLGESSTLRLKGVKSAANIASPSVARRAPTTNGQAFGNRYDFGASLSAAINAANTALGDRSGLTLKTPATKIIANHIPDADDVSPLTMKSSNNFNRANAAEAHKKVPIPTPIRTSGTDSPRPAGTEKPVLASQSYNELLDKYCFVRTNEHHWAN